MDRSSFEAAYFLVLSEPRGAFSEPSHISYFEYSVKGTWLILS